MAIGDLLPGRGFALSSTGLAHSSNDTPSGIGVDGTYAYVVDGADDKVYVYRLSDGARQSSLEFDFHVDNGDPSGIGVDDTYAYVIDAGVDRVYVYRLSDGARQSNMEFDLHSDNGFPGSLSTDDTHAYVLDYTDDKVYVYRLSDGARQSNLEFDLHSDNQFPTSIAVDGTNIYVVNSGIHGAVDRVYVYRLSDGARQSSLEFDFHVDNGTPAGIGVDDTYAYVVDAGVNRVYVYSILPPESAPGPPATPILTALVDEIEVSWFPPASPGTSPVESYDIRYKLSLGNTYTTIDPAWSSGDGSLTYTITGLTGGSMYDVQIRAVNDVDNGAWSSTAMITVLTISAPGTPDAPTVTAGAGSLDVTWTVPSNDGGSAITAYDLRYRIEDAGWTIIQDAWEPGGGSLSATIDDLPPGQEYEVQVRAVNAIDDGEWSGSDSATVSATVPDAPTLISLTPGDEGLVAQWQEPDSDSGAAIENYDVRWRAV